MIRDNKGLNPGEEDWDRMPKEAALGRTGGDMRCPGKVFRSSCCVEKRDDEERGF